MLQDHFKLRVQDICWFHWHKIQIQKVDTKSKLVSKKEQKNKGQGNFLIVKKVSNWINWMWIYIPDQGCTVIFFFLANLLILNSIPLEGWFNKQLILLLNEIISCTLSYVICTHIYRHKEKQQMRAYKHTRIYIYIYITCKYTFVFYIFICVYSYIACMPDHTCSYLRVYTCIYV